MEFTTKEPIDVEDGKAPEYKDVTELRTLNSMIPIWKKSRGEVSDEDYNNFYSEKYYDYEAPARVITQKSEGTATYTALLFIPKHAPFNYYTKDYEKGLELYSSGVMIMEKCPDLLPDYFGFVKGLVDSQELSLNISREMLQHDRQLKVMAKAIEKKIRSELASMMESDREAYEKFFDAFGIQLKYGVYSDYGMHKDTLVDLLLFKNSGDKRYISLKEYADGCSEEQKFIYYAAGESEDKISMLPQVEAVKSRGYEVLYLAEDVDEFALKVLSKYGEREFKNVTAEALDIANEDDKKSAEEANESFKDMLEFMKTAINDKATVKFSANLTKHPVCLSSEGELSLEMEKVLKKMPGAEGAPEAKAVLEINNSHPIASRLKELYESDKETLTSFSKILYSEACLISGISLDNPGEFCELISKLMI